MKHKKIVENIVKILFEEEINLSDGYIYYCGNTKEDVEAKLYSIAEKILGVISEDIRNS